VSRAEKTARLLILRGEPLPLDLHFKLAAQGIDVDALIARHAP
jgi:hypothetical protein